MKPAANVPVKKKKLPAKNELALKVKHSKKGQSQLQPSAKKPAAQPKPPPAGKRQALVDRPLVKVPWSVSTEVLTCVYNKYEVLKHNLAEYPSKIPSCLPEQFHMRTKYSNKCDCLIREMLLK